LEVSNQEVPKKRGRRSGADGFEKGEYRTPGLPHTTDGKEGWEWYVYWKKPQLEEKVQ